MAGFLKKLASNLLDDHQSFTDLTQVAVVDADACLTVLSKRFAASAIYTHCGPLLVAINPYEEVSGLYSDAVLREHLEILSSDERLPHVWEVSARAYHAMMESGTDQAIIVSGESGAGKTESAKFLIRYLADAAASVDKGLHKRIMGTGPITESFGCAQTIRNDNSSRFGKFLQLQFTESGRLAAATMQTYLLEKSRVVHISEG